MGTAKQRARHPEAQEPRKGQGKLNTSIVFSKPSAPGSPSRHIGQAGRRAAASKLILK